MPKLFALVFTSFSLLACSCNKPDLSTPEGLARHAAALVAHGDWNAYSQIAENPNAALLREAGGRPQPGSYAALMVQEGEQTLHENFDQAARIDGVRESGLTGTSTSEGSERWAVSLSKSDGTAIGVSVHIVRVGSDLRVLGFEFAR